MTWQLYIIAEPDGTMIPKVAKGTRQLRLTLGSFVLASLYAPSKKVAYELQRRFLAMTEAEKWAMIQREQ